MKNTIVALATPHGTAGLAVIRISGDDAFLIAQAITNNNIKKAQLKSHTILYRDLYREDTLIDQVTISIFKSPNSYTGEDVVEIGCHGGKVVYSEIIDLIIMKGARLSRPGEFTKRAFLNGKLDLTQVEAVADLIHSKSRQGALTSARQLAGNFTSRLSEFRQKLLDLASLLELELDFTEEDLEFVSKDELIAKINEIKSYCSQLVQSFRSAEILRSGFIVSIIGYPNSGKSTLFNTLLKKKRAITSDIPGTTRDFLEEELFLDDINIRLVDTAGIRDTDNVIEIEGIRFVKEILEQSNLIIVLNDLSFTPNGSDGLYKTIKKDYPDSKVLLVHNKTDLKKRSIPKRKNLKISAKNGSGVVYLISTIAEEARNSGQSLDYALINQRQRILLEGITEDLQTATNSLKSEMENEVIAIDIRQALNKLGEITGEIWSDDILNNIFSNFCIGK